MNLGIRYAATVACVLVIFGNFIACGARMYQVSLAGDHQGVDPNSLSSNDPSSVNYGLHAPNGWTQLPVHFKVDPSMTDQQRRALLLAMATWETAVGRKLFAYEGIHKGVTGDSFNDLYSSLSDGINGHYFDEDWSKTGKPSIVLATTIWDNAANDIKAIAAADIRFNTNFYTLGDSFKIQPANNREVVDLQTLALHELGHLLGLTHISPQVDSDSIMTASLYIGEGLANRRLSKGDVERIQKIYGCNDNSCDIDTIVAQIDALERNNRSQSNSKQKKDAH